MAEIFRADQRLSQNADGSLLTLIDFTNYNYIAYNNDDPSVNSSGNNQGISIWDFIDRRWYLQDVSGNIEEAIFPYNDDRQVNKCAIKIDKDKYLKITLVIKTSTENYSSVIETGLHRQAEYKLYLLSDEDNSCCDSNNTQKTTLRNEAANLIESARFKVLHFDNEGFNKDIDSANTILNHLGKL